MLYELVVQYETAKIVIPNFSESERGFGKSDDESEDDSDDDSEDCSQMDIDNFPEPVMEMTEIENCSNNNSMASNSTVSNDYDKKFSCYDLFFPNEPNDAYVKNVAFSHNNDTRNVYPSNIVQDLTIKPTQVYNPSLLQEPIEISNLEIDFDKFKSKFPTTTATTTDQRSHMKSASVSANRRTLNSKLKSRTASNKSSSNYSSSQRKMNYRNKKGLCITLIKRL